LRDKDDPPFFEYPVKSGDQLYPVIRDQGIASGNPDDIATKRAEEIITEWNKDKMIFEWKFDKGLKRVKWLIAGSTIKLPAPSYSPPAWIPEKNCFYWDDPKNKMEFGRNVDEFLARNIYVEAGSHSIFWSGDKFVQIDRNRNLCEQFYPPENAKVESFRKQAGRLLLIPQKYVRDRGPCFVRAENQLVGWTDPGWDPFVEKRIAAVEKGDSVGYSFRWHKALRRNGVEIKKTTDWFFPDAPNEMIDAEKCTRKLWATTRNRLILIHPD
jgi:hypothetical protein